MTWAVEGASGLRFGLRTLMLWIALLSVCLALGRVAIGLGVVAFGVTVPALARTLRVLAIRRAIGLSPAVMEGLGEMFVSTVEVVLAWGWAILTLFWVSIAASCLVNAMILVAGFLVWSWSGTPPAFLAIGSAVRVGLVLGSVVALVNLVREFRRVLGPRARSRAEVVPWVRKPVRRD